MCAQAELRPQFVQIKATMKEEQHGDRDVNLTRLLEPERLAISTQIADKDAMYGGNADHY